MARLVDGPLLLRAWTSIKLLVTGYVLGTACALVLTFAAISTRVGTDLLNLLTAMFNPLPAIALLPLALLWFGIGEGSLIFVLVHAVLWPLALNTYSGFRTVGETTAAGRPELRPRRPPLCLQDFGARGIPGDSHRPQGRMGLRLAHADRGGTRVRRELGRWRPGWYIFENRNQLEIPNVFAGLLTVIALGLFVEGVIFRTIERSTVRRWGMQR